MAGAEIELKPGELFECPHAGFRNQCVGKLLELRPARKASRDVLWVVLALLVGGAALWHFWFSGPRPILKLGVGGQEVDLGLIKPGTAGQAELEVRNAGDLELEISDVAVEGAGFSAKPKSLAVAPGKSDKILILFNTPALDDRTENGGGQTGALEPRTSSRFDGSMVLKSNDRRHPDLKVALHVTQEFADPEELLDRTIPGLPKRERSKKAEGGGPAREAGKEKQEEVYELLNDNAELGITIAAKLTSLDQTAGSDGDVKGTIVSFNAGGVQLELERDEVEHEGGDD